MEKKDETNKTNLVRTRHMWVLLARATNYHPSKHSSMAMSRADIFINSAPSPTSTTLNQQAIESFARYLTHSAHICIRDGIALLMHSSVCVAWCDVRAYFYSALASVIVIRQTHKNGYNSWYLCLWCVCEWSILDTCQNAFASCITHNAYWYTQALTHKHIVAWAEHKKIDFQVIVSEWYKDAMHSAAHENEFFVNAMAQMLCLPSIRSWLRVDKIP